MLIFRIFMCISRIFKCIFKSPPPKPDQSVIPLFFFEGKSKRQEGEKLASVQEWRGKSKIIPGRDIAAAKSKEKEHP